MICCITNDTPPFALLHLLLMVTFLLFLNLIFILGSGANCKTSIDPDVGGQEEDNNSPSGGGGLQWKTKTLIPLKRFPTELLGVIRVLGDTARHQCYKISVIISIILTTTTVVTILWSMATILLILLLLGTIMNK